MQDRKLRLLLEKRSKCWSEALRLRVLAAEKKKKRCVLRLGKPCGCAAVAEAGCSRERGARREKRKSWGACIEHLHRRRGRRREEEEKS